MLIENSQKCYLYKSSRNQKLKMYHRVKPNIMATNVAAKWNSPIKAEAGYLTKEQWKTRSAKWTFDEGWMLESITGEVEALSC